jgi:adenosylcobinamide-GDP ribazoletransferase
VIDGLRLALTTFTVIPVRSGVVDRRIAGLAMGIAPLVGALLGGVLAVVAAGLGTVAAPPLFAGVAVVAAGVLLTRALHLDGLADVLDALGSYAARERALAVMKQPEVGAFGVVGIVLAVLAQIAAIAGIASREPYAVLAALVVATATGRLAVTVGCLRGVPAARPDGLGALVAATVPWPVPAAWTLVLSTTAVAATPDRPWQGPVAVLAGLGAAALLTWHAVRRFGGITGDVLGAALEVAVTTCLAVLVLG